MTRQPTYTESIIYLVLACVLAAIYILTTMGYYYLAPDTPELRKRSVSLTIVGAIASTGVSTIFLVQAASPATNPSFLPLWGAYIGFAAWSVSLLGRVWRARFLADIRRAKANNQMAAAANAATAQQGTNLKEMHAQLRREQKWLRRRRAPMGDATLTGVMAAIVLSTLVCLILVQCMSNRYRLVPLDIGGHSWSNWEYIPFYVTSGFFMVILCPVIIWLLLGMHDAYNIASDLQLTVSFTLMVAPVYFIWTSIPMLEHFLDAIWWLAVLLFAAHVFSVVRPLRRALRLRLERRLLSRNEFRRALDDPVAFRRLEKLAEADFSVENCRFIKGYRALQERTETVKRQQQKREEEERLKAEQTAVDQLSTLQAAHVAMQTALAMRALGLPGTVEISPVSPQHYHMADDVARAQEAESAKLTLDWNPPRISCIQIPGATRPHASKSAPQPVLLPLRDAPSGMRARPMSGHSATDSFYSNATRQSEMIEVAQHVTLKTYHSNASVLPSPVTPHCQPQKRTSSLVASRQFNSASARATRLAEAPAMPALPPPALYMSSSAHGSAAPVRRDFDASTISPVPTVSVSLSPTSGQTSMPVATASLGPRADAGGACSMYTEKSEHVADFVNNGSLPDWLAEDYRRFYYIFLAEGALLEVNVDHSVRARVRSAIARGCIEPTMFDEAYHAVLELLYRNTFPRYVSSLLSAEEMDELDAEQGHLSLVEVDHHSEEQHAGVSHDIAEHQKRRYLSRFTDGTMHSRQTTSQWSYGRGRRQPRTLVARLRRWWRLQRDELTAWRDDYPNS
ncbi:hypothetical protein SYNPS1DRAFT_21845 [Syncephalis pseudoplumigaleata]|uniref:RGS domain-containing protein n=1 Tax=Syncephalis pseudoplumigaleata TaxID=1712513 RepID=A0A4P9Z1L3_9FUNG|nr:hypothetical protein SYNPS1DRAFT_21845 [Syncephalis pseudoplumigaleata]|eukprot:RKP26387.1 hypothetical protein SYNPS1DRAFT_21845 [Syncephalis pseudoplumigaleata]